MNNVFLIGCNINHPAKYWKCGEKKTCGGILMRPVSLSFRLVRNPSSAFRRGCQVAGGMDILQGFRAEKPLSAVAELAFTVIAPCPDSP
jgi:hypothetical protein